MAAKKTWYFPPHIPEGIFGPLINDYRSKLLVGGTTNNMLVNAKLFHIRQFPTLIPPSYSPKNVKNVFTKTVALSIVWSRISKLLATFDFIYLNCYFTLSTCNCSTKNNTNNLGKAS